MNLEILVVIIDILAAKKNIGALANFALKRTRNHVSSGKSSTKAFRFEEYLRGCKAVRSMCKSGLYLVAISGTYLHETVARILRPYRF